MFDKQHTLKLFLLLLVFIFFSAMGIKYVIDELQAFPFNWTEALVNSIFLTLICVPFFWILIVKPLQSTIELESAKSDLILELAAEGIVSIDTQGRILTFNQSAQNIFGYNDKEVIGKNISILMPPPHRDLHDGYLSTYMETGVKHVLMKRREVEALRKDGQTIPIELAVSEIKVGNSHFFTGMVRDISEEKKAQKEIEQLAHFDALTHLPNRRLFFDRLAQAITMAKRKHQSIVLMYLDLDGFKLINDTLGHHVGDLLLEEVAQRLRQSVRESDTLARLGGDEFTLLLADANKDESVELVARKIIDAIGKPFNLEGHELHVGVSIGIASYPEAVTARTLLVTADKAMYAAKAAGKNTYRYGLPEEAL